MRVKTSSTAYGHGTWFRDGNIMRGTCDHDPAVAPNCLPAGFGYDFKSLSCWRPRLPGPWHFDVRVIGWTDFVVVSEEDSKMMQCEYCNGNGARSYGETCTMCRGTGERPPIKIQLPPVLMDADVEQLEQALGEARTRREADRIKRINELRLELAQVTTRRRQIREEMGKICFTREDCPWRHLHKEDESCTTCGVF